MDPIELQKDLQERILKKHWQKAIILCNKLLEFQPDNHYLYITKGLAHMGIQNYREAAKAYQVLLDVNFSDGENDEWKGRLELCNQILDFDGNFVFHFQNHNWQIILIIHYDKYHYNYHYFCIRTKGRIKEKEAINEELMLLKLSKTEEIKTLNDTIEALQLEMNETKEELAKKTHENSKLTYDIDMNKKENESKIQKMVALISQHEEKLNSGEMILCVKQKKVNYLHNF